jgi:hypothetical protein
LAHVGVTRVLEQVGTIDLGAASVKDVTLAVQPGAGRAARGSLRSFKTQKRGASSL